MITNSELLQLNRRGFIPGPNETEESFCHRVSLCLKLFENPAQFLKDKKEIIWDRKNRVSHTDWDWVHASLLRLFDFSPDWLTTTYSNKKLALWQGAATWIITLKENKFPILQFRKALKKGSFLGIYKRDEILVHEAVHAARMAFDEPRFEEIFAYFTSCNSFRKYFGPVIEKPWESSLFVSLICGSLMGSIFQQNWLFQICSFSAFAFFSVGIWRLARKRWILRKAYGNLYQKLQCKAKTRAVLFRLTDKEIQLFAKSSGDEIIAYIKQMRESSLRYRVIDLAYVT